MFLLIKLWKDPTQAVLQAFKHLCQTNHEPQNGVDASREDVHLS